MPAFVKGKHFAAPTSKSSSTYDGVTRTGRASKPGRDVGAVWTDGPPWSDESLTRCLGFLIQKQILGAVRHRNRAVSDCCLQRIVTAVSGCVEGRHMDGVVTASPGQVGSVKIWIFPGGVLKEFHCKSDAEARAGGH